MVTKSATTIAVLFIASLGVLAFFKLWAVSAAALLLVAALVLHESLERVRVDKIESRVSLVQISGEEFVERAGKAFEELSGAVNFLRGELQHVSANVENRISALEQRIQSHQFGENVLDTQKYYDLVQKIISIENRISAVASKNHEHNEIA